jgi:hypothetical protein
VLTSPAGEETGEEREEVVAGRAAAAEAKGEDPVGERGAHSCQAVATHTAWQARNASASASRRQIAWIRRTKWLDGVVAVDAKKRTVPHNRASIHDANTIWVKKGLEWRERRACSSG